MSIYANAGLPNPLSPTGYDLLPADMARFFPDWREEQALFDMFQTRPEGS